MKLIFKKNKKSRIDDLENKIGLLDKEINKHDEKKNVLCKKKSKLNEQLEKLKNNKASFKDLLNIKWKIDGCGNKKCWCRLIIPDSEEDKYRDSYIVSSGAISEKLAKYIVKIHNLFIEKNTV